VGIFWVIKLLKENLIPDRNHWSSSEDSDLLEYDAVLLRQWDPRGLEPPDPSKWKLYVPLKCQELLTLWNSTASQRTCVLRNDTANLKFHTADFIVTNNKHSFQSHVFVFNSKYTQFCHHCKKPHIVFNSKFTQFCHHCKKPHITQNFSAKIS